MGTKSLLCEHDDPMRKALAGDGDCPVCTAETKLTDCRDETKRLRKVIANEEAQIQTLIQEDVEGPKPKREKSSKVKCEAECRECDWSSSKKNAMPAAAQHHDKTGHTVDVEQVLNVTYGEKATPATGRPTKSQEENRDDIPF